ncbi:MAG: hypothetical protein WD396_02780 [Pseudohongiellaceae bacterium]
MSLRLLSYIVCLLLMINNVPFDFMQNEGGHDAEYWRRAIGHSMEIQNEVMQQALGRRP